MHPITQFLFQDLVSNQSRSRTAVCESLTKLGAESQAFLDLYLRFEYQDEEKLISLIGFNANNEVNYISLMVTWPGDENGWSGWSEKREIERTERQSKWLQQHGYKLGQAGLFDIHNKFCPKSGFSSITLLPVAANP